ncbi:MAG: DNA damage-inducible protein D [Candidatus Melainabacteria bacterium]|nr:DNA damage-inducible protein D [Candidatus Melainabacteria bacterium]MBI3308090.1 DNA damage-inducible protein D [Candidatus Melainabacteria bacterium]
MNDRNKLDKPNKLTFESIKQINEYGQEYWSSRELAKVLGYTDYRNFLSVIAKAKEACKNSGHKTSDHFVDIDEMVQLGSGAKREIDSQALSRYACYLIVQNADPEKEIVALGQTYFAVQTRKQELIETKKYQELKTEEEKRLFLRSEMKRHNKLLAFTAKEAGIIETIDYAIFQDHGYKGLYGGLNSKDIHKKKRLKKNEQILDHMGSTELAANLFRATQTEDKLRRENIKGKEKANQTHFEVGQKVRKTIQELGGEMPENLPTAESIKRIEKRAKKQIKENK